MPMANTHNEPIPRDTEGRLPDEGVALCLSGGGYRAMLFHVGALWRLNEVGLLSGLDRVSSVSGGSIAAAYLALQWKALGLDSSERSTNFEEEFVNGIRRVASTTIDLRAVIRGVLLPGRISSAVAGLYAQLLLGDATLQDLPDSPQFVFNASNFQSGALWRFSKRYMRDWRVGRVDSPAIPVAVAVAASSAFPPFLSPVVIRSDPGDVKRDDGNDLHLPPYTTRAVLTDGGVYDNLGLETVIKRFSTILVSDGGGQLKAKPRPPLNWIGQTYRVLGLIDNQVRSLRKRDLIDLYLARQQLEAAGVAPDGKLMRQLSRSGTYWGIRTNIANYGAPDVLPCDHADTLALANVKTRLARLPDALQERLINWGYAVCDAALRRHVNPDLSAATEFPYARGVAD